MMHIQCQIYSIKLIAIAINKISKYKYFSTLDLKSAFGIDGKLYQSKQIPLSVTNGYAPFLDWLIRT